MLEQEGDNRRVEFPWPLNVRQMARTSDDGQPRTGYAICD